MRTALFMDKGHEFRFSAALVLLAQEGERSLRIAPAKRADETFVGVDVGGFVTVFRLHEVDDISKVSRRVDSLPLQARQFVDGLQACADHIKEEQEAQKRRML